jgi:hypothetical protein
MKVHAKSILNFALLTVAIALYLPAFAQNPYTLSANGTVASVAGTTWVGPDTHGRHYVYEFLTDGTLTYTYENGSFTNGTWRQSESAIYMSMNNKYSERLGQITGTHMEGIAWNVKGEKWTWVADRK